MRKKILFSFILFSLNIPFLFADAIFHTIPDWWKTLHNWDGYTPWSFYMNASPKYFGPNALPVPEMSNALVQDKLSLDIAGDTYFGYGDNTEDIYTKLIIPLFPSRVSLSLWFVPMEWYKTTEAIRDERFSLQEVPEGNVTGDLYVGTNIQLLHDKKYYPDVVLNIVLKTASGGDLYAARYYDTPAYWFDVTAGKSIFFSHSFVQELRVVGNAGFLCWQTLKSYQDDAFMAGLKLNVVTRYLDLETDCSGYTGWIGNGDSPLVLRTKLIYKNTGWRIFGQYQYGLNDYPYHQIRLGASVDINLSKK
jgi:hypothetical protein